MALYCYSGGLVNASLKLMYRARYLALLVYGEEHPDLATFDVSIVTFSTQNLRLVYKIITFTCDTFSINGLVLEILENFFIKNF